MDDPQAQQARTHQLPPLQEPSRGDHGPPSDAWSHVRFEGSMRFTRRFGSGPQTLPLDVGREAYAAGAGLAQPVSLWGPKELGDQVFPGTEQEARPRHRRRMSSRYATCSSTPSMKGARESDIRQGNVPRMVQSRVATAGADANRGVWTRLEYLLTPWMVVAKPHCSTQWHQALCPQRRRSWLQGQV